MFRRRSTATQDAPAEGTPGSSAPARPTAASVTAGKGRPTPKRSEAERRRRYNAPGDRKEALRQSRTRDRSARARKTEAMRRGEEWALPAKDKGPVRALARDLVDSKRRLSEFYMYGLVVLLFLLFLHNTVMQTLLPLLLIVMVLIMVVRGVLRGPPGHRAGQRALPRREHPGDQDVRGHARAADPPAPVPQAPGEAGRHGLTHALRIDGEGGCGGIRALP